MSNLTLALTGDSLITRPLPSRQPAGLERLHALVSAADVAYTNLEFICAEPPMVPRPRWHGLHVHSSPDVLDELADFGFNLFSLAHNHTMDYTDGGLLGTLRALDERGLVCAGAGATLSQARRPRYLDTAQGRVAILAACSTDAEQTLAADPDGIVEGRPGISPLRFTVEYELEHDRFEALNDIDVALGTAEGRATAEALGIVVRPGSGKSRREFRFLGSQFHEGSSTGVHSHPHEFDVADIQRWVRDARGQADLVVVALHCHEGARGQYNSDTIADFARNAARSFIDAGADVFVGHGPHQLAGFELHGGKPIFHSLGNFIFMPDTVATLPAEFLQASGLPPGSTAADFHNRHGGEGMSSQGFAQFPEYWESVVPVCTFAGRELVGVDLWPILIDGVSPPSTRGLPSLAKGADAEKILLRYSSLGEAFGVSLDIVTDGDNTRGRLKI